MKELPATRNTQCVVRSAEMSADRTGTQLLVGTTNNGIQEFLFIWKTNVPIGLMHDPKQIHVILT